MYTVYMHTAPSGKRYIGITCQTVEQRWRNGKGYKTNQPLYNAIQKYGWNNIKHEIIEENLTHDEACELEHKRKISQALKGIERSDEVRKRMSEAQVKTKKPVRCIDTGEVFESQTEAMKKLGIDKTLIGRTCKGKNKTAKGLRFEYV